MKKTQFIDLMGVIKSTRASFIAISLFIAMAVALFTGISWAIPGAHASMDRMYQISNAYDIDIVYPLGLTEENLNTLSQRQDVQDIEGLYTTCQVFSLDNISYQAKIFSLTDTINTPLNVEGVLPQEATQIAVEAHWAKDQGIEIGDVITFKQNGSGEDLLYDSFTVTALMEHPAYLSTMAYTYGVNYENSTPLDCLMFVDSKALNLEVFGGFSEVLITGTNLEGMDVFSDEYADAVDAFKNDLDGDIQFIVQQRQDQIVEEQQAQLQAQLQAQAMAAGSALATAAGDTAALAAEYSGADPLEAIREEIEKLECSVLTLQENIGVAFTGAGVSTLSTMRYIMSALFTLVGLLVCYSAIGRLVYEQITQLGTKKALGFRQRELRRSQLRYTGFAAILGCAVGLIIGRFIIEPLVLFAMTKGLLFDKCLCKVSAPEALVICAIEIGVLLLITLFACRKVLKRNAIDLLAGETPTQGKHRFYEDYPAWRRLSLLSKTIINNCFNDPRRIFATVVGVMGCTALLVTAITLFVNLQNSLKCQYDELYFFDSIVFVDDEKENANESLEAVFEEQGVAYAPIHYSTLAIDMPNGTTITSELFVPLSKAFNNLVYLRTRDGLPFALQDGLWIWSAAQNTSGVNPGDELEVMDSAGATHLVTIAGISDYYLNMQQSFMSKQAFEDEFGITPANNAYLVSTAQVDKEAFQAVLNNTEGFYLYYDYRAVSEITFNVMSAICMSVVGVYLVLSILVAVLVIFNLLVMFISEKKRELIVMMINGVSLKNAKKYIYSDTILLSIIGIILGCILGDITGRLAMMSLCNEVMYYLHEPVLLAWIGGAALSGLLVFIMTKIALKRIEQFELTDINRF